MHRKKCKFGLPEVQYLGHRVGPEGILPSLERVKAISEFETPVDKKALQRFLGMLNYYRRFLPRCSRLLEPLHAAVSSAGKKKDIVWSDDCDSAFRSAKVSLTRATLLHHPNPFSATTPL